MLDISKKVYKDYFKKVIIDVIVDDLVIESADVDNINITLTYVSNLEKEISEHLIKNDKYDVKLSINNDELLIKYYKKDLVFIDNINYVEMIGLNIIIPKDKEYKIIKHG